MSYDDRVTCPLGMRCESCGVKRGDLAVKVLTTGAGELCLTLCPGCAHSNVEPPITVTTAVRLVEEHRRHRHQAWQAGGVG
jgi:hypothetical protein